MVSGGDVSLPAGAVVSGVSSCAQALLAGSASAANKANGYSFLINGVVFIGLFCVILMCNAF